MGCDARGPIWQFLLGILLPLLAYAEQLPIRIYRTADGLGGDAVYSIVTDKNGYMWFGTAEGLSRFDGDQFTNYGLNEGLSHATVNALLATRDGGIWIGTSKGLCRFNAEQRRPSEGRFTVYQPSAIRETQIIWALAEDREGSIWCGTRAGLFRLRRLLPGHAQFDPLDLGESKADSRYALLVDRQGALWIGTRNGLYRRGTDSRIQHFTILNGLPDPSIRSLFEDRHGRLWVGTDRALCLLAAHPDPSGRAVAAVYPLGGGWVDAGIETSDGRLWFATHQGLWESRPGGTPGEIQGFLNYGTANGFSDQELDAFAEDRDGNLWIGSYSGAMKIARNGIRTYTEGDGLRSTRIRSIFENGRGELFVVSADSGREFLQRFNGQRFMAIPVRPNGISDVGWGGNQIVFEDHSGEWWIHSAHGLFRFPHVARFEQLPYTRPKAIFTKRDGLAGDLIMRVFEDSKGDIWISTAELDGLSRWQRSTNQLHRFSGESGFPDDWLVTAFREDRTRALWIGNYHGGVARYRENHFLVLGRDEGIDPLSRAIVGDIFADHAGRLWIATQGSGLIHIDDPAAEHPHATTYTTAQGLSSNMIDCVTEDLFGRIYIGNAHGLDRLNLGGDIEHFTTADGLALGEVAVAFRDRQGALWFGTPHGLSRWLPEPPQHNSPPPILIRGVRVRGIPQPMSELGQTTVQPFVLAPSQNQLQFDFVSISFRPAERPRYQYKLESPDTDWRPTETRSVNYASLPPGSYRFLVRAVDSAGTFSTAPAIAAFTILPPYWQRWWFRLLLLLTCAAILYTAYRVRLRGMAARYEERLDERSRIARELHDTLLQSLAGVSLQLDGVAKQIGPSSEAAATQIRTVRQHVDASFLEARQKVQDLRSPMLQGRTLPEVLRESLEQIAGGQPVRLQVTVAGQPRRLREELEETLLRIGQETVANSVRHAHASEIQVALTFGDRSLGLRIQDNGQGFNLEDARGLVGHWGLRNMQERAARIGAEFKITTAPGCGTKIEMFVPLPADK